MYFFVFSQQNSKYSSSKGVSQQYAAAADRCGGKGGDCKELDGGGGNFRSGVGGTPRMRGDSSPGGPNGNSSGGASSVPAAAALLRHADRSPDCENYKNSAAAAFQQQKVRAGDNKERDTRDYKRADKYSGE
ncbi:hypothetical protein LSTR_LSTR017445 [Laodelphax striatellus]|uniref:Uncharacterized protein n=1 Tax=Laodelphax striatellus TaxID=195883 RepID=A0A482XAJ4_LAOST|nr:hypothetical protein LSTR_LSTR017445 [Laodelphax striatellus]